MKKNIPVCVLLLVLISCIKDSREEIVKEDCYTGDLSDLNCFPTDSIYVEGNLNRKYWKAQKFQSKTGKAFKDNMLVAFEAILPFDSCKSQAYLGLGSDVWGSFYFKNVNDTIFLRNAIGYFGFGHAGFIIRDTNHSRSHRLILGDSLSRTNYITLSGINRDSSILEGSFVLEFINVNGSFESEYIYINGKFRLNNCK